MQQMSYRFYLMLPTIIFFSGSVTAQKNFPVLELAAAPAVFIYQGDLTPARIGSYRNMKPGIVLSAASMFSSSLSLRLNFSAGTLRGDETTYLNPEYRKFRAFKFRSPVLELSPQIVWNPRANNHIARGGFPYLFGGAAINFFRIQKDYSGYDPVYFGDGSDIPQRINADEQQRLPAIRFVIPFGAGFRYNLSHSFALNTEVSYRLLNTDYLDGFSKAANPNWNDHYYSISAGLIYRLGKARNEKGQLGCPANQY